MGLPFLQISTIPRFSLFILNEPFRAPSFCFLEKGEQHGTGTGVVLATVLVLEPRDRACTGSTGGHPLPKPLRELARHGTAPLAPPGPGMYLLHSRELLGGAQGSQCSAVPSLGNARKAQAFYGTPHHLEALSMRNEAQRSAWNPVPPALLRMWCPTGHPSARCHTGHPAPAAPGPEHLSELLPAQSCPSSVPRLTHRMQWEILPPWSFLGPPDILSQQRGMMQSPWPCCEDTMLSHGGLAVPGAAGV